MAYTFDLWNLMCTVGPKIDLCPRDPFWPLKVCDYKTNADPHLAGMARGHDRRSGSGSGSWVGGHGRGVGVGGAWMRASE
jgi:hypothetical protein